MNKDVAILLDILKRKRISITDFSKQVGVEKDNVYAWKAGRGNPKANDSEIIQKYIKDNSETEIQTTMKDSLAKNIEVSKEQLPDRNEESLHTLIKSNAMAVETIKDLKDMLKISMANLTPPQHISVVLEPLLHQLALNGVGKSWSDYDAGRRELGKMVFSTLGAGAGGGRSDYERT